MAHFVLASLISTSLRSLSKRAGVGVVAYVVVVLRKPMLDNQFSLINRFRPTYIVVLTVVVLVAVAVTSPAGVTEVVTVVVSVTTGSVTVSVEAGNVRADRLSGSRNSDRLVRRGCRYCRGSSRGDSRSSALWL